MPSLIYFTDAHKVKAAPQRPNGCKWVSMCGVKKRRLGVLAPRINYLCSRSWGESGRFETRPTKRSTRTAKSEGMPANMWQMPSCRVQWAGHEGWKRLEIYGGFCAKSCSQACVWMTQRNQRKHSFAGTKEDGLRLCGHWSLCAHK